MSDKEQFVVDMSKLPEWHPEPPEITVTRVLIEAYDKTDRQQSFVDWLDSEMQRVARIYV